MDITKYKNGSRVRANNNIDFAGVLKGDILTVRAVDIDNNDGTQGYLYFNETGSIGISADSFTLINKGNTEKKKVAREIHDKFCDLNHIDRCGWHYEEGNKNMWKEGSHKRWLKKANKLYKFCEDNNYNIDKFIDEVIPFVKYNI